MYSKCIYFSLALIRKIHHIIKFRVKLLETLFKVLKQHAINNMEFINSRRKILIANSAHYVLLRFLALNVDF